MQMKERGVSHPGPHSPDHPCTAYKITESAEPVHGGSLKAVMANAIERWFVDTLRNAKNGDANQAALLSEMLSTGYGCTKDAEEARRVYFNAFMGNQTDVVFITGIGNKSRETGEPGGWWECTTSSRDLSISVL